MSESGQYHHAQLLQRLWVGCLAFLGIVFSIVRQEILLLIHTRLILDQPQAFAC